MSESPEPTAGILTIEPLTGKWSARCVNCGKEYPQHTGSTPCCGSIATVINHFPDRVPPYDSADDTNKHIRRVQELLQQVEEMIFTRAAYHDRSKLSSPEKEELDRTTTALKALVYGSPEYRAALADLKPMLDHHYANNSHHPEFHLPEYAGNPTERVEALKSGKAIARMTLLDLVEMLCDWKAAGERHADGGDIWRSLQINAERFGIGAQLTGIFAATIHEFGWPVSDRAADRIATSIATMENSVLTEIPPQRETPVTKLPDGSGFFTATILSDEEAMALPVRERPLNRRISSEMYHGVFEAIGAASMCWKPVPSTEAYDPVEASKLATDLCFQIAEEIERREAAMVGAATVAVQPPGK